MKKITPANALVSLAIIVFLSLSCLLIINACKKVNNKDVTETEQLARNKFFAMPATVNPVVTAIAQSIRQQDGQRNFVPALAEKAGYPVWQNAMIVQSSSAGQETRLDGGGAGSGRELVLIPFVKSNGNTTNAVLLVNSDAALRDTQYHLVYASRYEDYGFDFRDTTKFTARNVFHLFTVFDNAIFGHKKFMLSDKRILGVTRGDTTPQMVTLIDGSGTTAENRMISISWCNSYEVCNLCAFRENSSMLMGGGCRCGGYYVTYCSTIWIDIGGEGGGGSGGGFPPSGGGGGGGWEGTNPCRSAPAVDPCGGGTPGGGTGPGGWVPIEEDLDDPTDSLLAAAIKKTYEKAAALTDSLFNASAQQNIEHCFTYVKNGNDTVAMWIKPGSENQSQPTLGPGFFGELHIHQDGGPSDWYKNQSFDGPDIYSLYYHNMRNEPLNLSIIATRDFVYAAVITDPAKFTQYIRTLCHSSNINVIFNTLHNKHIEAMNNCSGAGCTWQKQSELGVLAITANNDANISGIKIFKSPRQNINFTLLTP